MAIIEEPEVAFSSITPNGYHVFLSFRGSDVRYDFGDWLHSELVRAGIVTFRDDDEIHKGKTIDEEIEKAITESKVAIVVFSEDFASSTYCLDEVVRFMDRRRTHGMEVLPVFFKVDPSDVWEQKGKYGVSFKKHQERLQLLQGEDLRKEKQSLDRRREALRQVCQVAGHVYNDGTYQSSFIEEVVEDVTRLVDRLPLYVPSRLVGIQSQVEDINRWVQDRLNLIPIALLHGPSGIGKKTIAKVVYNQNYKSFDYSNFLENIGETLKQFNGVVHLQKQLLSKIKKGRKTSKIFSKDEGRVMIKEALSNKRVLIVLSGVDQLDQFYDILKDPNWLRQGSKIIITSRNEDLLGACSCMSYGVEPLGDSDARELFSSHAFGRAYPTEEYKHQVLRALDYCCGFPLALEVLGSCLSGYSPSQWENFLLKPEEIGKGKIQKVLKMSFDCMENVHEKNLFLDVAGFYMGKDKEHVDAVLDCCDLYEKDGIEKLMKKHLVTIDESNRVMMPQPIRDMAREIIHRESVMAGRRHRIWHPNDAYHILRERRGTKDTWSLILSPRQASTFLTREMELKLKTEAFARMKNLRLLHVDGIRLEGDYKHFPERLLCLYWHRFPFHCLPNHICLRDLVILDMQSSCLRRFCNGNGSLRNLKILNLSYSQFLMTTPDFDRLGLHNLEILLLKHCKSLAEIHPSIRVLKSLTQLNLAHCKSLKKLPREIASLTSLEKLILTGCTGLQSLKILQADGVLVNPLCSEPQDAKRNGFSYSRSIGYSFSAFLPSLVELSLENSNITDVIFPHNLGVLSSLQLLDLSHNPIRALPDTIIALNSLFYLIIEGCEMLHYVPKLPERLKLLNVCYCPSLKTILSLAPTTKLAIIGCENLVEIGGKCKLRTMQRFDIEMIHNLGLLNRDPSTGSEVAGAIISYMNKTDWTEQLIHSFHLYQNDPCVKSMTRRKRRTTSQV